MQGLKIGYALCGSFCTVADSICQLKKLKALGAELFPIMSENLYTTDTRFGKAKDINKRITEICEKDIIHTIADAEPIGPKNMFDVLIIAPCTSNTAAKLALGITDTSVTMAAKAHLRNKKPLVIAIATNDALGASSKNIGYLLNNKNIYFVPFRQDDSIKKPNSMIADFEKIPDTIALSRVGKQIQPIITAPVI